MCPKPSGIMGSTRRWGRPKHAEGISLAASVDLTPTREVASTKIAERGDQFLRGVQTPLVEPFARGKSNMTGDWSGLAGQRKRPSHLGFVVASILVARDGVRPFQA